MDKPKTYTAKAECAVCKTVRSVTSDVESIFNDDFVAWCKSCKDRKMHSVKHVKHVKHAESKASQEAKALTNGKGA